QRMVNLVVQFDFIENLFLPCHIRNGTTDSISYLHGLKEQCGLLIGRQKLDFQSHFHMCFIFILVIKSHNFPVKPAGFIQFYKYLLSSHEPLWYLVIINFLLDYVIIKG